jgi:hypothetical protein
MGYFGRTVRNKNILVVLIFLLFVVFLVVLIQYLNNSSVNSHVDCSGEVGKDTCYFINSPVILTETSVDLPLQQNGYYQLINEVGFVDSDGVSWLAPKLTFTDGASIPEVFIPLIGERDEPSFINAAVLHDAYCGAGNERSTQYHSAPWEKVHRMFYDSLRVNGTPETKAKIMFAAVYLGGPRWDDPERSLDVVSDKILTQEMELCIEFIEKKEPSIAQIIHWMASREAKIISESLASLDSK